MAECKVDQIPLGIKRQIGAMLLLKIFQFFPLRAGDPAGGGVIHRLVIRFDAVFVQKARHGHVKLQNANHAQNIVVAGQRAEDLNDSFFRELDKPFLKLFGLQGIFQTDPAEMFRGEIGDAGKAQFLPLGEGVADPDGSMVVNADDVSG